MRINEKQQRAMMSHSMLFPSSLPQQMPLDVFGEEKSFAKDLSLSSQERKKLQKKMGRT